MTKRFGLTEITIEKINEIFAKYPQVEKVVLYGSRAKGNYKNGSDIDLTLFGHGLDIDLLHKILNDLEDLLLPYTIDLSIFEKIDKVSNSDFVEHIDRVGVIFYKN
ncbi:MAG: nucleotidyltransferase domain-containing protein [Oligoflexia bacterium]|nr:nucleotidyltransferase domain-containing protein [Oligoflexia bacterium]